MPSGIDPKTVCVSGKGLGCSKVHPGPFLDVMLPFHIPSSWSSFSFHCALENDPD